MTPSDFEKAIIRIEPRLNALARKFTSATSSPAAAEDLVQEAEIALWELVESGYEIRNFEALAVTVTKNLCVSHYRRQKLKIELIKGDNYPGGESPSTRLEDRENERLRGQLLSRLSATERELLNLRNESGLTLDEIAALTGKPKTSIKTTLSAARRKMLTMLMKT